MFANTAMHLQSDHDGGDDCRDLIQTSGIWISSAKIKGPGAVSNTTAAKIMAQSSNSIFMTILALAYMRASSTTRPRLALSTFHTIDIIWIINIERLNALNSFHNTNMRPSAILHHLQILKTQANITQATICDNQLIKQHGSSGTDDSTHILLNANLVQDKPNV